MAKLLCIILLVMALLPSPAYVIPVPTATNYQPPPGGPPPPYNYNPNQGQGAGGLDPAMMMLMMSGDSGFGDMMPMIMMTMMQQQGPGANNMLLPMLMMMDKDKKEDPKCPEVKEPEPAPPCPKPDPCPKPEPCIEPTKDCIPINHKEGVCGDPTTEWAKKVEEATYVKLKRCCQCKETQPEGGNIQRIPFVWGYENHNGPTKWVEHFKNCSALGMRQSPIKFMWDTKEGPPSDGSIAPLSYKPISRYNNDVNLLLQNDGHSLKLEFFWRVQGAEGKLKGGPLEGTYTIDQLHLHWGSEHEVCVSGVCKEYPLEAHLVFKKDGVPDPLFTPKGLAVLGFFIDDVQSGPAEHFPFMSVVDAMIGNGIVGAKYGIRHQLDVIQSLFMGSSSMRGRYAYYQGSLTSPPCNEVVEWLVFTKPIEYTDNALASVVQKFKSLKAKDGKNQLESNKRPANKINKVLKYYNAIPLQ